MTVLVIKGTTMATMNCLIKLNNILQVTMCKVNYKACVFYEVLFIFLLLETTTIIL